jgi:hypothetical protein
MTPRAIVEIGPGRKAGAVRLGGRPYDGKGSAVAALRSARPGMKRGPYVWIFSRNSRSVLLVGFAVGFYCEIVAVTFGGYGAVLVGAQ